MAEKSTGQWVGTIVGAVVGYLTGGTSYILMGAAFGGMVGGAIDPPKGPHLFGPRLNDLSQQSASYGAAIPRLYGTVPVFGNIFWIENNAIKETSKTEGGGKGGGGPETTTYTYSATFALGLGEGPIDGIRRIWVSGKLIYDAGSSDLATILASNAVATGFTLYRGTADQLPDPRMQASLGAANVPAYRGLAYLVFEDFELGDYGNTLLGAQIKVEVVESATYGAWTKPWSRDYAALLGDITSHKVGIPTVGKRRLDGLLGYVRGKTPGGYTTDYLITIKLMREGYERIAVPPPLNSFFSRPNYSECDLDYIVGNMGLEAIWMFGGANYGEVLITGLSQTETGNEPTWSYFSTEAGIHVLAIRANSGNKCWLMCFKGPVLVASEVVYSSMTPRIVYDELNAEFSFIFRVDATSTVRIIRYDYPDFNRLSQTDAIAPLLDLPIDDGLAFVNGELWSIYNDSGFSYLAKFDVGTFTRTSFENIPAHAINGAQYDWVEDNAIVRIAGTSTAQADILVTGKLTGSNVPLSGIVQAECLKSGLLDVTDLDVTSLTDPVRGYRISASAAIRAGLEPLQGAWPFDVVQAGYKIKFVRRNSSGSVLTIAETDLGARAASDKSAPALTMTREMDSQLPARVTVKYFDVEREYDTGEQYAERLNTESINERSVEFPVVFATDEAAQRAEALIYMYWLERYEFNFTLPPSYRQLEPADVVDLPTTKADYRLRITGIHYLPDGSLECSARLHGPLASTALGVVGNLPGSTISQPGQTAYALIDAPTLLDTLDGPGFLVAMSGHSSGWIGAVLYRSADGGQAWNDVNTFVSPSVMGYATTSLPAPADSRMIDKKNTLTVDLFGDAQLFGVTEGAMLNGANHFAYGADGRWEIIAAQNAVLQGDGTYILSDLLRGRFGSEWAMAGHQAYDKIIQLDINHVQVCPLNLNAIGLDMKYRAVSKRSSIASAETGVFTYKGVNLECLAPVYLNGSRHPSTNDWSLSWIRRTRIGGEWRDRVDASLGEDVEGYEVEIYSASDYATLKRTITGLATAACSYTSAQQVTDFGSNQATLYIKVYQLSADVGRGQPLTTSITR